MADKDMISLHEENDRFRVTAYSVIGDRAEQQDRIDFVLRETEAFLIICDGMGGMKGGSLAAQISVEEIAAAFREKDEGCFRMEDMLSTISRTDRHVYELHDENGNLLGAGSTFVSVLVRDGTFLWCSVGDSRGYLLRGESIIPFTKDQNYQTVLDEQRSAGLITPEAYAHEKRHGEALISYLGIGDLSLIDYSSIPVGLHKGDRLILMTDGLYRLVPETVIRDVLNNFANPLEALQILDHKAAYSALKRNMRRDNLTAALLEIR